MRSRRISNSEQQQTLTLQEAIDLAVEHHNAGRLSDAEIIYQRILQADPNHPIALHLLGVIAHQTGNNNKAINLITKALAINPTLAEAHSNLGLTLQVIGKLAESVTSYRKAIDIKPDYAEAHNNLGNALHDLGKSGEAVASYQNALAIKPDYAEAHCNLGHVLTKLGKVSDAIRSLQKALSFKHDLATAHYRLHFLLLDPSDMRPSIKSMERAVVFDPSKTEYRFVLGMLLDYSGDPKNAKPHFDMIERGSNLENERLAAWRYIKSTNNNIPSIFGSRIKGIELCINAAKNDGLVLEFGVSFGSSIRQIASLIKHEVHGFDSFEGLPEAWHNRPKGSYSTRGIIPSVPENVILHKGWFEKTLPDFVEKHPGPVRLMNIDCDVYSSTKTILEIFAKQIIPGTVLLFDEYIGNECWREDEFKAFQEAVLEYGWEYEYLCFSFATGQVGIRIN